MTGPRPRTRRERPPAGAAPVRLFVAVELPPPVREAIGRLQDALRPEGLPLRWVRPDAVHLTLRFIGPVQPVQREPIERALAETIPPFDPFPLRTAGLGVFGGNRARVLWLDLAGDLDRLDWLHRAVDAGLDSAGLPPPEHDRFAPHLTLARVPDTAGADQRRRIRDLAATTPTTPVPFEVARVALIRSHLGPNGARYETLRQFPM